MQTHESFKVSAAILNYFDRVILKQNAFVTNPDLRTRSRIPDV